MKLKNAKTCEGCKAIGTGPWRCELNFNNRGAYDRVLGFAKYVPQEPCYKPRTIAEYFEAKKLRNQ